MAAVAEFRGHHQMAGGAKDRERSERQQHGIEPSDHRCAGDAGVAEHLRDVHRREGNACQGIAHRLAATERPDAAKEA